MPNDIDLYNMTIENNSTFIDIGSGFGKPVFHAAMQTSCPSYGVEVLRARVAFSLDMKFALQDEAEALKKRRENSPKKVAPPINNLAKSAQKKEQ